MSDRVAAVPTLETRMDDIRAVMDAAGSERAVLFGSGDAGPVCALFAATYPERTEALVVFNAMARNVRSPDLPWLPTRTELEHRQAELLRHWEEDEFIIETLRRVAPSATQEELEASARIDRMSISPGTMAMYQRMTLDVDVRDVLPLIHVPALVAYRTDAGVGSLQPNGRYLANHIRNARAVALPGADLPPMWGDQERLFSELERFLADIGEGSATEAEHSRVLATILFTDIVGATARAVELGDRAWRELLRKHDEAVRVQLGRFRGTEIDTAGDGFFATFDGPARAIRCACAVRYSVSQLGLELRAGLHSGECEVLGEKVGGIAVHIGARVAARAQPGDVLVSSTVKDLVAGSGIAFEDRGLAQLKGVPGEWRLYAVREAADP
jgi:class 3 adenylate cyclase